MGVLAHGDLRAYARDGFLLLEEAFPRETALRCRDRLWEMIEERQDEPATWTRPVVRIFSHPGPEFEAAASSPRWVEAICELAGPDVAPPSRIGGTTAVRFPVAGDPGDDGWHIDGSYVGPDGGYWANHRSRERALLMLVLFSDVGIDDAPTRIRVGSHHSIPDLLIPYGEEGVPALQLSPTPEVHQLPQALATGRAGDVYLCHPFLVHAAQRHRGTEPRFVAQPGVPWRTSGGGLPSP